MCNFVLNLERILIDLFNELDIWLILSRLLKGL